MGQPKRRRTSRIYYANVRVGSVRLRDSLETDNYQEALRRQRELVAKVEAGQISAPGNPQWLRYKVAEALDVLNQQRQEAGRSEGTVRIGRERSKPLKRLLGTVPLVKIDAEAIRQYQATRLKEGVSGRTVNMEVGLVRLLLKKVKRWRRIEEDVETLPERHDLVPRVLNNEEKKRLFSAARSNPNWYRALYVSVIAVNTTARKFEILRTRFADVDLFAGIWRIPKSKTQAGCREIMLNQEARAAFARMYELAQTLSDVKPEHFIFCGCQNKTYDYSRPQKSVATSWRSLTRDAGLKGLRVHDLRHQAITELAEANVPESVMKSMAGHMSRKMLEHYTHVRLDAKRKAVEALGGTGIVDSVTPVVSTKQ